LTYQEAEPTAEEEPIDAEDYLHDIEMAKINVAIP
jgi:hypothetical protein